MTGPVIGLSAYSEPAQWAVWKAPAVLLPDSYVQHVAAASRGQYTVAGLAAAVAAYRPPYAACCLGEAALASWEAPTGADKRRQEGEVARYRAALRAELDRM